MGSYRAPVLTHLINLCIEHDRMPVFKLEKISPLFKSGDYRPVAVLPALSKVIETLRH